MCIVFNLKRFYKTTVLSQNRIGNKTNIEIIGTEEIP